MVTNPVFQLSSAGLNADDSQSSAGLVVVGKKGQLSSAGLVEDSQSSVGLVVGKKGFEKSRVVYDDDEEEVGTDSLSRVLCEDDEVGISAAYKDAGDDTILFENSSSLIELKNASYAPSLLYGAAGDQEDSVSYTSNAESKSQNSRQSNSSRKPQYGREQVFIYSVGFANTLMNSEISNL